MYVVWVTYHGLSVHRPKNIKKKKNNHRVASTEHVLPANLVSERVKSHSPLHGLYAVLAQWFGSGLPLSADTCKSLSYEVGHLREGYLEIECLESD